MKKLSILLIWLPVFVYSTFSQIAPSQRLNILFLFADDQRADTIGAWGNKQIKTPNLDRLVSSGFSFMNNYVFGGNSGAVCLPSRAMLMSGKTWFRVNNNLKNTRTLPELLAENGYSTFATGKWHNGEESFVRIFQQGKSIMFGGMADHTKVPIRDLRSDKTLTPQRIGEKFSSELFADAAIEFLKNHDKSKPFFAYIAFTAPHDPRNPPLPYREPYYKNLPPLPKNFLPQLPFDNGFIGGRDENLAPWPRPKNVIRNQLAEYYGLITHLDEQIGRILQTLKELGLDKNTIIIYAADNGLALGSHGLLGKQNVYEHSMKVPLIFAGPGIPSGKYSTAFTYLFDIFPTICDLAAIQAPNDLDGQSLKQIWDGKKDKVRDSVFLPFLQIQRAVRDEQWKLICYPKISYMELFDLKNDPYEKRNLIFNPKYETQKKRLLSLMKQWQEKCGDSLNIPDEIKKPQKPDFSKEKLQRKPDQWQPDWIVKKYFSSN
jgi:arylsulfatase A-like enzyme